MTFSPPCTLYCSIDCICPCLSRKVQVPDPDWQCPRHGLCRWCFSACWEACRSHALMVSFSKFSQGDVQANCVPCTCLPIFPPADSPYAPARAVVTQTLRIYWTKRGELTLFFFPFKPKPGFCSENPSIWISRFKILRSANSWHFDFHY